MDDAKSKLGYSSLIKTRVVLKSEENTEKIANMMFNKNKSCIEIFYRYPQLYTHLRLIKTRVVLKFSCPSRRIIILESLIKTRVVLKSSEKKYLDTLKKV